MTKDIEAPPDRMDRLGELDPSLKALLDDVVDAELVDQSAVDVTSFRTDTGCIGE
ncbi:hypothetical protein ACFWZT_14040 [Streptomyces alboflavus]|uniref:hypothetical protein n=1 Tax=Streptomyces alboflavus TaxID=67267 RepID=UPI003688009D